MKALPEVNLPPLTTSPLLWHKGLIDSVFGQRWEAQRLNSYRVWQEHGRWIVKYRLYCMEDERTFFHNYRTLKEAKLACAQNDAYTLKFVKQAFDEKKQRSHKHHAVCSCGLRLTQE